MRHKTSPQHIAALAHFAGKAHAAHDDTAISGADNSSDDERKQPCAVGYSHVLFQRMLVESGGSFTQFPKWLATARLTGADVPGGAEGRKVSKQLCQVMAERETHVTTKLLDSCARAGLAQDARGPFALTLFKLVLWQWPRGLSRGKTGTFLPCGVVSLNSGNAPWVATRIAAVAEGKDKAALLEDAVAKNSSSDTQFLANLKKPGSLATDGAFDALSAGARANSAGNLHLPFRTADESHTGILVLKHALQCDDEVREAERLICSGKDPKSLSRFLKNSSHLANGLQAAEQADCLQAPWIQHLLEFVVCGQG